MWPISCILRYTFLEVTYNTKEDIFKDVCNQATLYPFVWTLMDISQNIFRCDSQKSYAVILNGMKNVWKMITEFLFYGELSFKAHWTNYSNLKNVIFHIFQQFFCVLGWLMMKESEI